jgi:hypothetical protein
MAQKPCYTNSHETLSIRQPILEGTRIDVGDFRQQANIVILSVHHECNVYMEVIRLFVVNPLQMDYDNARVLAVTPEGRIAHQVDCRLPYLHT